MSSPGNDTQFNTLSAAASFDSPLWRYFLSNLAGEGVTDLSKLAADRQVETVLNAPLAMRGTVPSDDPQVWITDAGDGDPFVAEGTRLLWGLRRESETPPYYVPRGATLCQLVQDTAQQDDARTHFTGFDPWKYLMARPIVDAAGNLPGENGTSFTATQASVIIATLLKNTIVNHGHAYVDAGTAYAGTAIGTANCVLETGAGMVIDIAFQQGTTVGQAWAQITDLGVCDIVLTPVYDPFNRPNYLVELNVYAQAGSIKDEQIFAWNSPGRNLVAVDRQEDGTGRANKMLFFTGQGGKIDRPTGPTSTDAASVAKFGQYWDQQFFPGQIVAAAVQSLSDRQLALRKDGKTTVTFSPAPERSPRPWQDYNLGDRVPVWVTRQEFRKLLAEDVGGSTPTTQYQRIYGWLMNISDDALETVDPLLTSPQGFTG